MAKKVQHKSPKPPDDGVVPGCWCCLFSSFDIQHRLHHRKPLVQRRDVDRRRDRGIKVRKAKLNLLPAGDENYFTKEETNIIPQVEDRTDSDNKDSGKAQMGIVTSQDISKQRGMSKQKGQKHKVKPLAKKLSRTISIHHMECDDYVLPAEMTDDSEVQEGHPLSDRSNSSAINDHMPSPVKTANEINQDKRCEVCGTLSGAGKYLGHVQCNVLEDLLVENQALLQGKIKEEKSKFLDHRTVDGKGLARDCSKDFLEALGLFNANRELLLRVLHEQNATTTNYLQGQKESRTRSVLDKSGSFPGAGFPGRTADLFQLKHKRDATISLAKGERESSTENSQALSIIDSTEADKSHVMVNTIKPVSNSRVAYEVASNSECSSGLTNVMKSQRNNGTAVYRFKDIKQRIKDIVKENREERHRISRDGVLHKIPYGCKVSQEKPSSWEVVGDGSRNSFGSDKTDPTYRNGNGHMRRSISLTESMDRYSYLLESNFSKEPKRQMSKRLNLVPEDSVLQHTSSPRTFGRMLSLPEYESYLLGVDQSEASRNIVHSRSISVGLVQENVVMCINRTDEQKMSDISDASLEHIREDNASPASEELDKSMLDNTIYAASDELEIEKRANTLSDELETMSRMEWSDKPAKPSPISGLDSDLPEDVVSPTVFSILQGSSELKPVHLNFQELDTFDSPINESEINDSNIVETDPSDINEVQHLCMQPDFGTLCVLENTPVFHFVRDVLKNWVDGDEHFSRLYSPHHQLSTSISKEAEASPHEFESNSRDYDMSVDYDLLRDLTYEVLLEIYENSYSHCPWLSHSCSHVRPIPVGYHLLEEMWANVSWHVKSQPPADPTLENMVSKDYTRNDRWMKLHYDVEDVGLDLELLIFDDLVDEAMVECLDL